MQPESVGSIFVAVLAYAVATWLSVRIVRLRVNGSPVPLALSVERYACWAATGAAALNAASISGLLH